VFSPVELADTSQLVIRFARNQLLLVRPSPMEHVLLPIDVTSGSVDGESEYTATILSRIHRHIIHNCIDNVFPELLYAYLDFWRYLQFLVAISVIHVFSIWVLRIWILNRGLEPVSLVVKKSRLLWFGHVEHKDDND